MALKNVLRPPGFFEYESDFDFWFDGYFTHRVFNAVT
jgi:hypothetical protein